jgi:hypothetical protein
MAGQIKGNPRVRGIGLRQLVCCVCACRHAQVAATVRISHVYESNLLHEVERFSSSGTTTDFNEVDTGLRTIDQSSARSARATRLPGRRCA